jgi:hypothetical protein
MRSTVFAPEPQLTGRPCPTCGSNVQTGQTFCATCGSEVAEALITAVKSPMLGAFRKPTPTRATASFVLGLVAFGPLPLLGGILAILFSRSALKIYRQEPGKYSGRGLAVAGLVLGLVNVGVIATAIVLAVGFSVVVRLLK